MILSYAPTQLRRFVVDKKIIEQREIPLPPLPPGSESSLRIVDVIYQDGSVKRLWARDDGIQVLGLTADGGNIIAIIEKGYTHLVIGYIEPGEKPESAARREFLEETGYDAKTFELLSAILQDSGGSGRVIWLYLATDCRKLRNGENGISVVIMPPDEFWELITTYIQADPGGKRNGLMSLLWQHSHSKNLGGSPSPTNQRRVSDETQNRRRDRGCSDFRKDLSRPSALCGYRCSLRGHR